MTRPELEALLELHSRPVAAALEAVKQARTDQERIARLADLALVCKAAETAVRRLSSTGKAPTKET